MLNKAEHVPLYRKECKTVGPGWLKALKALQPHGRSPQLGALVLPWAVLVFLSHRQCLAL